MKITVFHPECGRDVLVQQILSSQGHCPWDGKPFSPHYTAVLAESLGAAEIAGAALENALARITSMRPNLTIRQDSVLEPLREKMARLNPQPEGSPA